MNWAPDGVAAAARCGYPHPALIRPAPLRRGDVVRVVAPSGPVDPENLRAGVAILRGLGLEVRFRADVTARHGYLAGDDARRLAEWREASADREARALFCARGGYGAMRILDQIDPTPLLDPAKWVVGFSDVTALHALLNRAGLVTLHAPLVTTLGHATPAAVEHLRALLFGERPPPSPGFGPPAPGAGCLGSGVIRPGHASGVLLGGSLTLLAHLCGTRFFPPLGGAVLFLEDVGEKPYRLDRYLTQLRLAGALETVRAVCVGHLTACDFDGLAGAEVVRELVRALGVPAIEGVAAGHADDNLALPLGAPVTVIAPGAAEGGPPRILFDAPAVA